MRKVLTRLVFPILLSSTAAVQAATVAEVFNGDMLGTNQRYFESVAGIPRESSGSQHVFKVQGCNITATIEDGSVTALRLETSKKCQADLATFISSFAPPSGKLITFGAFEKSSGGNFTYSADCLVMCGNAYDPSVYALWEGPRAINNLQVLLEVTLSTDQAIDAANKWESQIRKAKDEDFVVSTSFNCDPQFAASARDAFANVPVSAITIGTGLTASGC